MINTSRRLKDLIRNLAAQKSADSQLIMREYMTERFLERVSLSSYRDKIILKDGSPRRRWLESTGVPRWILTRLQKMRTLIRIRLRR